MSCLNFQLFSLLWQYQSIFACQGSDSLLTISQGVDEIKRNAPLASKVAFEGSQDETETQSLDRLFLVFFFSIVRVAVPFLWRLQRMFTIKQKVLKKSFAKKCGNILILNFVSFETTWCCYNANLQECSPISKIYYYMIILYCYQPYVRHIMIHVLVLWLIILHNTPLSKYKRNIPFSLYIANGLIFVAKKIRG